MVGEALRRRHAAPSYVDSAEPRKPRNVRPATESITAQIERLEVLKTTETLDDFSTQCIISEIEVPERRQRRPHVRKQVQAVPCQPQCVHGLEGLLVQESSKPAYTHLAELSTHDVFTLKVLAGR